MKSLKKKGVRQISSYQRELNKLNQVVDETMMQIKKNIQKDKVDRDRLTAMSRTTKKQSTARIKDMLKMLPLPNPTIDGELVPSELEYEHIDI